jgi:hypothetical protein
MPTSAVSRVSETPMGGRVVESPEPEDDLGELMVMTDEEDDDDEDQVDSRGIGLIPETPAK